MPSLQSVGDVEELLVDQSWSDDEPEPTDYRETLILSGPEGPPARKKYRPGPTRGLALKQFLFTKEMGSKFQRLFNADRHLFLVGYAWDLSRRKPYIYPALNADPTDLVFDRKPEEPKNYEGVGDLLYPPQPVKGGISVRLHVWHFNGGKREFGERLQAVEKALDEDGLADNIADLATTVVAGPIATATKKAAQAIIEGAAKAVGEVLSQAGDEQVDFMSGHYRAKPWDAGVHYASGRYAKAIVTLLP